jgi:hypothetical protein
VHRFGDQLVLLLLVHEAHHILVVRLISSSHHVKGRRVLSAEYGPELALSGRAWSPIACSLHGRYCHERAALTALNGWVY